MNIERLIEIAEWLEAGAPERAGIVEFNMRDAIEPVRSIDWACKTACCIAGAAIQFERSHRGESPIKSRRCMGDIHLDAIRILGINFSEAHGLFFGNGYIDGSISSVKGSFRGGLNSITPEIAARTIRHFIATGDIDWTLES
jgi:hypothetical protein